MEEKSAALHALGAYAEHVSGAFAPYIEQSLKIVQQMSEYFHDSVREEAFEVLGQLMTATEACFPPSGSGVLFYLNLGKYSMLINPIHTLKAFKFFMNVLMQCRRARTTKYCPASVPHQANCLHAK